MTYDSMETAKVNQTLKGAFFVTVFASKPSWIMRDGTVKGWRVLVEQNEEQPFWVNTYTEALTQRGKHQIEYDRNVRGERFIKPYRSV